MPRGALVARGCFVSVLLAALLLCGCESGDRVSPRETIEAKPSDATAAASNPPAARDAAGDAAEQERRRVERIAQLTAELGSAQVRRAQYLQEREAINARIVEHEERGMALLDTLKAEMRNRESATRDDVAFKAEARSKLEAALSQDNELTTALNEIDARLRATDSRIEALTAERKALQEN